MNAQEIYDKVVDHLLYQNKRSIDIDGRCLYRGPNGTKCAVGCLIPDELYMSAMEGNACTYRSVRQVLIEIGIEDFDLLSDLQQMHDNNIKGYSIDDIIYIAEKYNLKSYHLIE